MTEEKKNWRNTKGVPKGIKKLNRNRLANSGLTIEQEAYSRCRAVGMSIEEAIVASNSSVSVNTARGWECPNGRNTNQKVRARINELSVIAQNNAILRTGLTREWVITRFMKIADRCMQAEPVTKMVDGEIIEIGEYKFDSSGANTALKALGEAIGLFKQAEKPTNEFEHLSDAELARLAKELESECSSIEDFKGNQT